MAARRKLISDLIMRTEVYCIEGTKMMHKLYYNEITSQEQKHWYDPRKVQSYR
jgi:hypothetical protein